MRIEPDLVEYGSLHVANANRVLGNIVANIVGLAIDTRFGSGPSHPHGEGMGVMVPTVEALFQGRIDVVLHHRCAAEFSTPDDQGLLEETALLEVGNKPGDGSIDLLAFDGQGFVDRLAW